MCIRDRRVCLLHAQLEVAAPFWPQHAGASERQEDPQWRLPQASVPFGPVSYTHLRAHETRRHL
eukprot:1399541-Prorocentrum_lima.AAC.1